MVVRERCIFAIVFAALVYMSYSSSSSSQTQRQVEAGEFELISGMSSDQYGPPERCLSGHEYQDFRALDDRRILFMGSWGFSLVNGQLCCKLFENML